MNHPHDEAIEALLRKEFDGPVSDEGFSERVMHRLRSDLSLTLSEDPPMVAIAVDARARVQPLLAEVTAMPCRGLVTLERTRQAASLRTSGTRIADRIGSRTPLGLSTCSAVLVGIVVTSHV